MQTMKPPAVDRGYEHAVGPDDNVSAADGGRTSSLCGPEDHSHSASQLQPRAAVKLLTLIDNSQPPRAPACVTNIATSSSSSLSADDSCSFTLAAAAAALKTLDIARGSRTTRSMSSLTAAATAALDNAEPLTTDARRDFSVEHHHGELKRTENIPQRRVFSHITRQTTSNNDEAPLSDGAHHTEYRQLSSSGTSRPPHDNHRTTTTTTATTTAATTNRGDLDVFNVESTLPEMNWDLLEEQLRNALQFERRAEVRLFKPVACRAPSNTCLTTSELCRFRNNMRQHADSAILVTLHAS